MDDAAIARALTHDFSVGTEALREDMLQRCLAVLDMAEDDDTASPRELDDSALDMLAAAGTPFTSHDKQQQTD